jgi:acetylornithine deacetylase/succinyl-diaminopimelate desuccinylase-like protein
MIDDALAHAREHQGEYLASLRELLTIPSISSLPERAPDMERAAGWLAEHLRRTGLEGVDLLPTDGCPVVYGEWLGAGPGAPVLLAYGHYDVQPVDPLEEWLTPPFEPSIRGDRLFARGASDDKGQLFVVLSAIDAYLKTAGRLPLNVKVILEGEEEIASPHMAAFIREHRGRLAAEAVLISDGGILTPDLPLISHGVRGMAYMEVEVRGPATDLHSGTYGGAVDNPFNVLVRLLARLQDAETGRVTIPGFYDRVRPLDEEEQGLLAQVPMDDEVIRRLTGAPALAGEVGYSALERTTVRPTLDIHGLAGGFSGAGKKTVIPARALAKVSMRLVPDQDPEEIARLFIQYLESLVPPTVELTVRTLGTARPAYVDYKAPAIRAAHRAYELGFGRSPVYMRGGGSLPIVSDLQDVLGVPVVMMGFGLPDDNAHAPNEWFHLPTFYRGIGSLIHYYDLLAGALAHSAG